LLFLSSWHRGVQKSPTITVIGSICVCKSSDIYLVKWGAMTLGIFKLTIVLSS
jgi:hypothetical protein